MLYVQQFSNLLQKRKEREKREACKPKGIRIYRENCFRSENTIIFVILADESNHGEITFSEFSSYDKLMDF